MDRVKDWFRGLFEWLASLTPGGRTRMINKAREQGAFLFAQRLARMNREQRRLVIKGLVKELK
jgi:hypothetical protein